MSILKPGSITYSAFRRIIFHCLTLSLIYVPSTSKSKIFVSTAFFLKTKLMSCNSSVSIVSKQELDIGIRFST